MTCAELGRATTRAYRRLLWWGYLVPVAGFVAWTVGVVAAWWCLPAGAFLLAFVGVDVVVLVASMAALSWGTGYLHRRALAFEAQWTRARVAAELRPPAPSSRGASSPP